MGLFFKQKRQRGRTKKTSVEPPHKGNSDAAVVVTGETTAEEGTSSGEDHGDVKYKKKNNKRVNWGQVSHKERMDKAVSDWLDSKGDIIDSDEEVIDSLKLFCGVSDSPYNTFKKCVGENENKRRKIGSAVGCRPLIPSGDQRFVAEMCARQDRGNDGIERRDVFEYIRELKPGISRSKQRTTMRLRCL